MDISDKIREIMHHFKLNQTALGQIGGVTGTTIGDMINGKTSNPKSTFLIKIAKELNISLHWLLLDEGEMIRDTPPAKDAELKGMLKVLMKQVETLNDQMNSTK